MNYPQPIIGETLGLSGVRGGEGLTLLITLLEAARRRVHWPFLGVAGAYRFMRSVRRALLHSPVGSAPGQLRAKPKRTGVGYHTRAEPEWDSSLRQ